MTISDVLFCGTSFAKLSSATQRAYAALKFSLGIPPTVIAHNTDSTTSEPKGQLTRAKGKVLPGIEPGSPGCPTPRSDVDQNRK
jgi:hypothetical protein